ncbi:MAG: type 4a pilus biogenesis protein PilO [Minisyncoccia bacterium]
MKRESLILILFFLCGVFFFGFVFPKYQEYQDFKKALEEKKNIKNILEKNLETLQAIEKKSENYKETIEKISFLNNEENLIPSLFYFLQKEGNSAGVLINSINFGDISKSENGEKIKELPFEIKMSSSFGSFLSFLERLENSMVIINFEEILINKKQEGDILDVSLRGKIFF